MLVFLFSLKLKAVNIFHSKSQHLSTFSWTPTSIHEKKFLKKSLRVGRGRTKELLVIEVEVSLLLSSFSNLRVTFDSSLAKMKLDSKKEKVSDFHGFIYFLQFVWLSCLLGSHLIFMKSQLSRWSKWMLTFWSLLIFKVSDNYGENELHPSFPICVFISCDNLELWKN